ncbi:hypothetical protein AB0M87_16910 [Streptomyces sp. NPDC051320]|uniref:hypothetical protein n=1 Tax=Streptomyces sp. NPDC051320 TaxID=3154644 RepID=UPI003413CB48
MDGDIGGAERGPEFIAVRAETLSGLIGPAQDVAYGVSVAGAGGCGVGLRNFAGPPQLAAKGRAMELIDEVVAAQQATQRAQHAFARARDSFDAYIAEHPDIREEAEAMVSNAIAESITQMNAAIFGPPPGGPADADHSDAAPDA